MAKIRFKALKNGGFSIYLDSFVDKKRVRTFPGLTVSKDYSKTKFIQKEDLETMSKANALAGRDVAVSLIEKPPLTEISGLIEFLYYVQTVENKKDAKINTFEKHIKAYTGKDDVKLANINPTWLAGFTKYMDEHLSENTVSHLHFYIKHILNEAHRKGLIKINPLQEYHPVKILVDKPYLSASEQEQLLGCTTSIKKEIQLAFKFSLFTGLTWDQVKTLEVNQLKIHGKGNKQTYTIYIYGVEKKNTYSVLLNEQAIQIIKEVCDFSKTANTGDSKLVFQNLPNKPNCNIKLHLWGAQAGLSKVLCFSMARNTFVMNNMDEQSTRKEIKELMHLSRTYSAKPYQRMFLNQ